MTTYGERLDAALAVRRPNDKNPRQWLADQIDISVQAVGQVIKGKTKALTAENHEKAVMALGCSGLWLATGQGEMAAPHNPASVQQPERPPALAQALKVVATHLNQLAGDRREFVAQHLQTLARAPDSKLALESLMKALDNSAASQSVPLEASLAGRIQEATLSVESRDIHPAKTRN